MSKVEELLESISSLTLVEAYELVKAIEDKFEVSAAAPVGVAVAAPAGGGGGDEPCQARSVLRADVEPPPRRQQRSEPGDDVEGEQALPPLLQRERTFPPSHERERSAERGQPLRPREPQGALHLGTPHGALQRRQRDRERRAHGEPEGAHHVHRPALSVTSPKLFPPEGLETSG